ncbi:MAG: hypothetical protein IH845_03640 [Nanoarchaeota archaeon]|nr:hypothetical protein [Nanoarchaeota archaeon]
MRNGDSTQIQRRIEHLVTNGLRYDAQSSFKPTKRRFKVFSIIDDLISEDYVKNSNEGLQSHLVDLNYIGRRLEEVEVAYCLRNYPMKVRDKSRGYGWRLLDSSEQMKMRKESLKSAKLHRSAIRKMKTWARRESFYRVMREEFNEYLAKFVLGNIEASLASMEEKENFNALLNNYRDTFAGKV